MSKQNEISENHEQGNSSLGVVSKRIYLTFADFTCDGAYSTLEKANERIVRIVDEYPDMEGVFVISREIE